MGRESGKSIKLGNEKDFCEQIEGKTSFKSGSGSSHKSGVISVYSPSFKLELIHKVCKVIQLASSSFIVNVMAPHLRFLCL